MCFGGPRKRAIIGGSESVSHPGGIGILYCTKIVEGIVGVARGEGRGQDRTGVWLSAGASEHQGDQERYEARKTRVA